MQIVMIVRVVLDGSKFFHGRMAGRSFCLQGYLLFDWHRIRNGFESLWQEIVAVRRDLGSRRKVQMHSQLRMDGKCEKQNGFEKEFSPLEKHDLLEQQSLGG